MTSTDVELMQQLKEVGKLLSRPPDSVDELLRILDQVEKLLLVVDQSPSESMQEALKPTMTALVKESLLRHSNVDVKVAVASCISEITRITAPEAPYNDEEMKDVFELIVSSFENLSDKSSRSYKKRASIVETVSKVRSCVVMLDLECDGLIVDMFERFLKSVRDHHSESVFSSMMNIMVLVLEESEDISVNMLKPLLASIKKNNEGVLPVARKLGEGVLQKSANKLRPYLIQTLRSLGDSLDNYSQVLASICEETTAVIEQADESNMVKESSNEARQADESKRTTASSNNMALVVIEKTEGPKSPKSVMSNGTLVACNKEASTDHESPKKPEEAMNHQDSNLTSKVDPNDSVSEKLESKPEQTSKKVEKISDKESSIEARIPSETEKNTSIPISVPKETENEVANASPSEISDKNAGLTKINQVLPQEQEVNAANAASPSQNGSIIYESRIKSGRTKRKTFSQLYVFTDSRKCGRKKAPVAQEDGEVTCGSDAELLKMKNKKVGTLDSGVKSSKHLSSKGKKDKVGAEDLEAKKAMQSDKKTDDGELEAMKRKPAGKKQDESDSDVKPMKQSGKKGEKGGVIGNPSPSGHTSNNGEGCDLDTKPLKLSAKKGNTSGSGLVKYSSKKNKDGNKNGRGKNVEEKDQEKSLSENDGMDVSPKSAKGEGNVDEALLTTSKRKRSMGKDKVTETIKYDNSLVGSKVKVWWPKDKTYYEGVIKSFDSTKQKHKVVYLDGDLEILNLRKEKWEILEDFSVHVEEKASEVQSADGFLETQKKKPRRDSGLSDSQEKSKDSAKRSARSSKGKGKVDKKSKDTDVIKPEAGMSKEDDNANARELEGVRTPESAKVGSKSGNKRKMRA